jgi:hypothetical protein
MRAERLEKNLRLSLEDKPKTTDEYALVNGISLSE